MSESAGALGLTAAATAAREPTTLTPTSRPPPASTPLATATIARRPTAAALARLAHCLIVARHLVGARRLVVVPPLSALGLTIPSIVPTFLPLRAPKRPAAATSVHIVLHSHGASPRAPDPPRVPAVLPPLSACHHVHVSATPVSPVPTRPLAPLVSARAPPPRQGSRPRHPATAHQPHGDRSAGRMPTATTTTSLH